MENRTAVIETVCTAGATLCAANHLDTARFADSWCLIDALH